MKTDKIDYLAPAMEEIKIEIEQVIAVSSNGIQDVGVDDDPPSTPGGFWGN